MRRKDIDAMREVRLWATTVIVPLATVTMMAYNNPIIVERIDKIKENIKNKKNKITK